MADEETRGSQSPPKIESAKTLFHKKIIRTTNIIVMIAIIIFGIRSCWNNSIENAKVPVNQEWKWVMLSPRGNITKRGEVKIIHVGYDFIFEASYKDTDGDIKWARCEIDGTTQDGTWIQETPLPNGKYKASLTGWKQTQSKDYQVSQAIGYMDGSLMYVERVN